MDLRIERTKRSIINAFIELRSRKPIEKITVKELAELAYINKATFYSHYRDIYDLSEQLEDELMTSIVRGIPHPAYLISQPKLAVYELMLAMTSQNELLQILFSGNREGMLEKKLAHLLKEEIYQQYPEYKNNPEVNIILSIMIYGGFRTSITHSDMDNNETIRILGEVNACIAERFFSSHQSGPEP